MHENPITRPIAELSADLRLGKLTSLDLLENALDRIAMLDRKLESFVCLAEDARDQAAAADREIAQGRWRGPLHGVPVAVKDNYLTADMPSHAGTDAPPGRTPQSSRSCAKPARSSSVRRGCTNSRGAM
jgi:aspartyl-tRNA(Asn)/glutamyl-tRNA(Gln) amidotransferase subunit A